MKIMLVIAETPYLSTFFSKIAHLLSRFPYCVEIVLYYNSELANKDYGHLFNSDLKTYRYRSVGPDEKAAIPIELNWSLAYISWERQWHAKAFTYDGESIHTIINDLHVSISTVIDAEKPDFVFYEYPSSLLGEVLYQVCLASGFSKYLAISQSRIPSRIEIADQKYSFSLESPGVDAANDEVLAKFNNDFISKRVVPSYMLNKGNASLHEVSLALHYFSRLARVRFYLSNIGMLINGANYETQEAYGMLFSNLRNHALRRFRQLFFRRGYDSLVESERYILFPLHLVPESSVSGCAMFFSDLITTIRYVAFSLPIDFILYVKEHPSAVGTRDARFYREIKKIPNVRLIAHDLSNEKLIRNADSIVTLSSTLGLEAALIGKYVFLLGDVVYQYHPMCIKIRSIYELREKILKKRQYLSANELQSINVAFWREYMAHTIPGNILDGNSDCDSDSLYALLLKTTKVSTVNT
jgi:hypothetical protein